MEQIKLSLDKDNNEKWLINLKIKEIKKSFKVLEPLKEEIMAFFDEVIKYLTSNEITEIFNSQKIDYIKSNILILPTDDEYPDPKKDEINHGIIKNLIDTFKTEVYEILDDINENKIYFT